MPSYTHFTTHAPPSDNTFRNEEAMICPPASDSLRLATTPWLPDAQRPRFAPWVTASRRVGHRRRPNERLLRGPGLRYGPPGRPHHVMVQTAAQEWKCGFSQADLRRSRTARLLQRPSRLSLAPEVPLWFPVPSRSRAMQLQHPQQQPDRFLDPFSRQLQSWTASTLRKDSHCCPSPSTSLDQGDPTRKRHDP